jgi:CheY-like chemotaxis protein
VPRVLIVEDEPLISMTVEDMLSELGYEIAGVAARIDEALALIEREQIDGALLDVNLGADKIDPVADLLAQKGCPFVFTTGDGPAGLPASHADRPYVAKPFRLTDLEAALAAAIR